MAGLLTGVGDALGGVGDTVGNLLGGGAGTSAAPAATATASETGLPNKETSSAKPPPADKTSSPPASTAAPQKTTTELPKGTDTPDVIVNPAKPGDDGKEPTPEPAPPATSTTKAPDAPKPTEATEKKPEAPATTAKPTTLQTSVLPTTTSPPPLDPVSSMINTPLPETTSPLASGAAPQSGMPMGVIIGIVAGSVGALVLIITSILLCRRYWRRRREGDNEQLKQLDSMYEQGKPTGFETMPGEKERWQRGLEQYHDASLNGANGNFTTGTTSKAYR
ncbi:hypothetical protein PG995_008105 [Apiospora arundinis]